MNKVQKKLFLRAFLFTFIFGGIALIAFIWSIFLLIGSPQAESVTGFICFTVISGIATLSTFAYLYAMKLSLDRAVEIISSNDLVYNYWIKQMFKENIKQYLRERWAIKEPEDFIFPQKEVSDVSEYLNNDYGALFGDYPNIMTQNILRYIIFGVLFEKGLLSLYSENKASFLMEAEHNRRIMLCILTDIIYCFYINVPQADGSLGEERINMSALFPTFDQESIDYLNTWNKLFFPVKAVVIREEIVFEEERVSLPSFEMFTKKVDIPHAKGDSDGLEGGDPNLFPEDY